MDAETLLLQCVLATAVALLPLCQTPDAKLISITSPNINKHYSDVRNAM